MKSAVLVLVVVLRQHVCCAVNCCHDDVRLLSCSCEVKFVQERGFLRLWEVARFDFLLPHN